MKRAVAISYYYTFTDRSFDELLFLYHKKGLDPSPQFSYFSVKHYMLSRPWNSFYEGCRFLERYLEVKQ